MHATATRRPLRLLLLPLAAALLAVPALQAAPLRDRPVSVTQPDGTPVPLLATGDEHWHRLHDADGFTVVQDPGTGWWVYGALQEGALVPTPWVALQDDPLAAGLVPGLRDAQRARLARQQPRIVAPTVRPAAAPLAAARTCNNLVVFVRFAGEAEFATPRATFDGRFNTDAVSLKRYFLEASYNRLTVATHFFPASAGTTVVSYQDARTRNYYRPYSVANPEGYTGGTNGDERIAREQALVAAAARAIAAQVPPTLDLDSNGDGLVDNVVFIVSGQTDDAWAEILWPHAWALYLDAVAIHGKWVYTFNLQFEGWMDVGVLAHEMFHALGAPDLYHYGFDGLATVGPWDLMEGTASVPQHMSAWMKQAYGGWLDIPVKATYGRYVLTDLTKAVGQAIRVPSPTRPGEFFVLEYRNRAASPYEASLPGSGLLAFRVEPAAGPGNADGPPDEVYLFRPGGAPGVNGTVDQANLAAGTGRTELAAGRDPYPFHQDGSAAGIRVWDVSAAGSTVSFRLCTTAHLCDGVQCGDDGCGGTCGCDDGNPCTADACLAGTCVHDAAAADGTACVDGDPCTVADACAAGACRGRAMDCPAPDACRLAGACVPGKGVCAWPSAAAGTPCADEGNRCTADACDGAGACTHVARACVARDACHVAGTCDPATGICSDPPAADGKACDDRNACTADDACRAGTCGGRDLPCAPPGACRGSGTCNPATGACAYPVLPDGTPCDDGLACTRDDACGAGACGGSPLQCPAPAECQAEGACDPATGRCLFPARPDGTACQDGNACTLGDACVLGSCGPGAALACTARDACHLPGTCDPDTGRCSDPPAPDGGACDDGDPCTVHDACRAGDCRGTPRACPAPDGCHRPGTCDPGTGLCSNPLAEDGTPCQDGDPCTLGDACRDGTCGAGPPMECPAPDACHEAGTCDPETGRCANPPRADGWPCDDGNACTPGDACRAGTCEAGPPVECPAPDACHEAGTCDPATGTCDAPRAPDGTGCDDGDPCTWQDACREGACGGVAYACVPGACEALSACDGRGGCQATPRPEGTPCDDGDRCTAGDGCVGTWCLGAPVACTEGPAPACDGDVRVAWDGTGSCDPEDGRCRYGSRRDPCAQGCDPRQGACGEDLGLDCGRAPDAPCRKTPGRAVWDPAREVLACAYDPADAGTPCDDGDPCTSEDRCDASGACSGAPDRSCGPDGGPADPGGADAPDPAPDAGDDAVTPEEGPADGTTPEVLPADLPAGTDAPAGDRPGDGAAGDEAPGPRDLEGDPGPGPDAGRGGGSGGGCASRPGGAPSASVPALMAALAALAGARRRRTSRPGPEASPSRGGR